MIICQDISRRFLSGWIDWTDIVRLDTASNTEFHFTILTFLKSTAFQEIYSSNFRSVLACDEKSTEKKNLNLIKRLDWLTKRKVNIDNCLVHIYPLHLEQLDSLDYEASYPFVKEMVIFYDDIKSYVQLANVVMERFPGLQDITIIGSKSPDELFRALNAIIRYHPVNGIGLDIGGKWENYSPIQLSLLCRLIQCSGEKLNSFRLPLCCVVPHEIVQSISTYCPNMHSIFSDIALDHSFTIEALIATCQKMKELRQLVVGTNGFKMSDSHLEQIVRDLPHLQVISIWSDFLTIRSAMLILQLCPAITQISLAGISWVREPFDHKDPCLIESSLSFRGISTAAIKTPAFAQFFQVIPILSELSFQSNFDILSSHYLYDALSSKHSSNIKTITINVEAIDNLEQMTVVHSACKNLLNLTVNATCHDIMTVSHVDYFVNSICLHCTKLFSISLNGMANIKDYHIKMLLDHLPDLRSIELQGDGSSVSKQGLFAVADSGRVWEYINTWSTSILVVDIVAALELHGLKVKQIKFRHDGCHCMVGYGKAFVRIVDVLAAIL